MPIENDKELLELEKELKLVERNLELLHLIADKKATKVPKTPPRKLTYQERFPIGSPVKLTGPRESPSLRNKRRTVTGHTPQFVKVTSEGQRLRRAPDNLTPSK